MAKSFATAVVLIDNDAADKIPATFEAELRQPLDDIDAVLRQTRMTTF